MATLFVIAYSLLALFALPNFHNRIVVLALESILLVAWLASFADLASWAAAFAILNPVCTISNGISYCVLKRMALDKRSRPWESYRDALAAAAGLGALEFVLFIITLVVYSLAFHRMRVSGAPYFYRGVWSSTRDPVITPTGATIEKTIDDPIRAPVRTLSSL